MRRRAVSPLLLAGGLCCGSLLSFPDAAHAEPGGDGACRAVLLEAKKSCLVLSAKQKRQAEIATAADDAAKAELLELQRQIAELEALATTPLCPSLEGQNALGCDPLASLLEISLQGLASAPTEEERAADAQLDAKVELQRQPDRQTSTNKAGSSAQTDPVESIQPISLAGGAFTLSGTRTGTKGVGTITLNPLALGKPRKAYASRLLDLTIAAPFDLDGGVSANERYLSARLRVNAAAPLTSAELQQALTDFYSASGKFADGLEAVLLKTSNVKRCTESILKTGTVTIEACDATLDQRELLQLRQRAHDAVVKGQRAADAYYFGLDARLDVGDPTGDATTGDDGTHLLAGVAAGIRIPQGKLWDFELRSRLAADYFRSRDQVPETGADLRPVFSVDYGGAVIFSGLLEKEAKQRLAVGLGIEGRYSKSADADYVPTKFANLNLMVVVPTTSGSDLGLAISIPLEDAKVSRGTIVSLTTDLGLLDHSGAADE